MRARRVGDPWFTVFYRDPHTLWWAPGLAVGAVLLVLYLLVFDSSVTRAVTIAALIGGVSTLGTCVRWRGRSRAG